VALRPSGGVVLKRSDDASILHCFYVSQVFCARVTHSEFSTVMGASAVTLLNMMYQPHH
jgi:hypothetical protein